MSVYIYVVIVIISLKIEAKSITDIKSTIVRTLKQAYCLGWWILYAH